MLLGSRRRSCQTRLSSPAGRTGDTARCVLAGALREVDPGDGDGAVGSSRCRRQTVREEPGTLRLIEERIRVLQLEETGTRKAGGDFGVLTPGEPPVGGFRESDAQGPAPAGELRVEDVGVAVRRDDGQSAEAPDFAESLPGGGRSDD